MGLTEQKPGPRERGITPTRLRRLVQAGLFLLVAAIGVQFYLFVASCLDPSRAAVPRPPGVGGFLPIAGLMGLRHWLTTGHLDTVQPSAAVLLLLAILVSLALKKSFCSWICPVGTLSEWLWIVRGRLFKRWPRHAVPRWLDALAMAPKYLLLVFFGLYVLWKMAPGELDAYLQGPYNRVADVRMLAFFLSPSNLTLAILALLVILSFLAKNAWCRYLCPYGALLGLTSFLSPVKVRRVDPSCTHCSACTRVCPMHLSVHELGTVRSPECTGCLLCVDACPVPESLVVTSVPTSSRRRIAWGAVALVLLVYFGGITLARVTGHWRNGISRQEYERNVPPAMQHYPENLPQPDSSPPDGSR